MRAEGLKENKRRLRELCFSYRDELTSMRTLQDQYNLLYDVQERARRDFKRKLATREVLYEIGKIFGISTQTIYRARSAVRAVRNGLPPKRYSMRTYNNLKNNIKSR